MNPKMLAWVALPIVLSAGVIWLSAQDAQEAPKAPAATGVKVADLAQSLQAKEKQLAQKEQELRELEQRLYALQATLDTQRNEVLAKEKTILDEIRRLEDLRARKTIDPQLIRTYEAMDPTPGAAALSELAKRNMDVAVALVAGMVPKKAAKLMDALALKEAELAGRISEKVGLSKKAEPAPAAP
jgi:flagellar motility protein MotE (MotC chaperone)